jgi:RNA polymerase II C-terminal domain phosphatase-like 3/4
MAGRPENGTLFQVWQKHKENLILMERYHFFASSCRQFGFGVRSLSESLQDERESDGALATVLDVLKRIHATFFDMVGFFSSTFHHILLSIPHSRLDSCKNRSFSFLTICPCTSLM